jgi:hypothetical protein
MGNPARTVLRFAHTAMSNFPAFDAPEIRLFVCVIKYPLATVVKARIRPIDFFPRCLVCGQVIFLLVLHHQRQQKNKEAAGKKLPESPRDPHTYTDGFRTSAGGCKRSPVLFMQS